MLVFIELSSMKTNSTGSAWAAARATQYGPWQHPYALARPRGGTFFERQIERGQRLVDQPGDGRRRRREKLA
jgi:hypothetical protein